MEVAIRGINQKFISKASMKLLEKMGLEIHYRGNKIDIVKVFRKMK